MKIFSIILGGGTVSFLLPEKLLGLLYACSPLPCMLYLLLSILIYVS